MKRLTLLLLAGALAVLFNARPALALPPFGKQFLETYKDANFAKAAKEAKCNVCHFGKTKKNRNDYGAALNKFITKDDYKKLKEDKEALKTKIEEALKAAAKEKSVSGEPFVKLMEAGKLPGTEPTEEEEKE